MSTPAIPTGNRSTTRAADAIWRRLCDGLTDSWLDDIRTLRGDRDPFDSTLDIWTVGLTAQLRNPERQATASLALTRLQALAATTEGDGSFEA